MDEAADVDPMDAFLERFLNAPPIKSGLRDFLSVSREASKALGEQLEIEIEDGSFYSDLLTATAGAAEEIAFRDVAAVLCSRAISTAICIASQSIPGKTMPINEFLELVSKYTVAK